MPSGVKLGGRWHCSLGNPREIACQLQFMRWGHTLLLNLFQKPKIEQLEQTLPINFDYAAVKSDKSIDFPFDF